MAPKSSSGLITVFALILIFALSVTAQDTSPSPPSPEDGVPVVISPTPNPPGPRPVNHVILVHSWFQGPWVWDPLIPYLTSRVFRVTAVQLPGFGNDTTLFKNVRNVATVAEPIIQALNVSTGPFMIVALGYGAVPAAYAAQLLPEKVARLVYVSGILLPAKVGGVIPRAALAGRQPFLNSSSVESNRALNIRPRSQIVPLLYGASSSTWQSYGTTNYRAAVTLPWDTPLELTIARWGSVRRYYIYSEKDQLIPFATQRWMVSKVRVIRTFILPGADHSSPLSKTDLLQSILRSIVWNP